MHMSVLCRDRRNELADLLRHTAGRKLLGSWIVQWSVHICRCMFHYIDCIATHKRETTHLSGYNAYPTPSICLVPCSVRLLHYAALLHPTTTDFGGFTTVTNSELTLYILYLPDTPSQSRPVVPVTRLPLAGHTKSLPHLQQLLRRRPLRLVRIQHLSQRIQHPLIDLYQLPIRPGAQIRLPLPKSPTDRRSRAGHIWRLEWRRIDRRYRIILC